MWQSWVIFAAVIVVCVVTYRLFFREERRAVTFDPLPMTDAGRVDALMGLDGDPTAVASSLADEDALLARLFAHAFMAVDRHHSNGGNVVPLLDGMDRISGDLDSYFAARGCQRIPARGTLYDPRWHVVSEVLAGTVDQAVVDIEVAPGWLDADGRVIRRAVVTVTAPKGTEHDIPVGGHPEYVEV